MVEPRPHRLTRSSGELLIPPGHDADLCHIQHQAATDLEVDRYHWAEVAVVAGPGEPVPRPVALARGVGGRPRTAPSATDDPVLALLELLATCFGLHRGDVVFLDLASTHAQLPSATGRTRPTVPRALQRLTRGGALAVEGSGADSRYPVAGPGRSLSRTVRHRP